MRWGQDGAVRALSCPCFFVVEEKYTNTQKERLNRNLFELFADNSQIIEVNLTERRFMSIMIP